MIGVMLRALLLMAFTGAHGLSSVSHAQPATDNPNEWVRLTRFPPGLFEMIGDWTTTQLRLSGPVKH